MHPLLLDDVIALCRRRLAQGDSPTEQPASVETLENAVIQLADTLASELRELERKPSLD